MQANLIGRTVVHPWNGKFRGVVVGYFQDRATPYVLVEKKVEHATDGRSDVTVEGLVGLLLAKEEEESPGGGEGSR